MWTKNHTNPEGEPCDGCLDCLKPYPEAVLDKLRLRTKEWKNHQRRGEQVEEQLEIEYQELELQIQREKGPLDREVELHDRDHFRETTRLRGIFEDQKAVIFTKLEEGRRKLRVESEAAVREVKDQLDQKLKALNQRHQAVVNDLKERQAVRDRRVEYLRDEAERARKVQRETQTVGLRHLNWQQNSLRQKLQQVCPHPQVETLQSILERWPREQEQLQPGYLKCRVCQKDWSLEELQENVRRGGLTLAYDPIPCWGIKHAGDPPGGTPGTSGGPSGTPSGGPSGGPSGTPTRGASGRPNPNPSSEAGTRGGPHKPVPYSPTGWERWGFTRRESGPETPETPAKSRGEEPSAKRPKTTAGVHPGTPHPPSHPSSEADHRRGGEGGDHGGALGGGGRGRRGTVPSVHGTDPSGERVQGGSIGSGGPGDRGAGEDEYPRTPESPKGL